MFDEDLSGEAHARVGSTVGKYRLDALLGVGGTAAVYAGTHRNGNRVAIKVLHEQYASTEKLRARFLREGYVANKVDHPGTVRVLDDESTTDATYLVMELLEGETLDARAERHGGRLPPEDVTHHGIALLDVLERAHVQGIVHRDLKPENIFLTTQQQLKILDFGIARLRDASNSTTKTQTGMLMGTPAFLSPEQALGHSEEIDARTDIWATGATMFSLLTGRHVHEARGAQEALVLSATQPAPPVRSVAPHVPEPLAQVVDRALRFRKEERFANAVAMRMALAQIGLARLTLSVGRAEPLRAPGASAETTQPVANPPTMMTAITGQRPAPTSYVGPLLVGALVAAVTIAGGLLFFSRKKPPLPETPIVAVAPPETSEPPAPTIAVSTTPSATAVPSAAVAVASAARPVAPPRPVGPAPTPVAKPSTSPKDMFDPR